MQKKKYHDKTARPLSVLQPNQTVRLQTDKGFDRKCIVTGIAKTPRSYIVQSGDKEYRRNRRHLLPVAESHKQGSENVVLNVPQNVKSSNKVIDQNQSAEKCAQKVSKSVRISQPAAEKTIVNIPTFSKTERSVKTNVSRSGRIVKPNPKYGD